MRYLDCHEEIQHRTGDFPLAHYSIDENFPRYRMSMHWHKETEIIRVHSGSIRIYLDGSEVLLEKGDLLAVGSSVIHGGEPEHCVYECIVFDPSGMLPPIESCRNSLRPLLRHNLLIKSDSMDAVPLLREAADRFFALAGQSFQGKEIEMQAATAHFLSCQLRHMTESRLQTVSEQTWQKAEHIKPALEYIEKHFAQHISLEELAGITGYSPKYFCRYFRTIVHRSPIDYLNYYRFERAAQLLSGNDMTVAEIALRCGFADSSAFIKQFRKYKSTTPRQYRFNQGKAG